MLFVLFWYCICAVILVISDTNIWQGNELEYRSNLKCTLSILKLCEILSWDLRISSKVAQSLESGGQNCKTKDSWEVCFDGTAVLYHIQFITNLATIKKSETITLHVLSSNHSLKSHAQEIPEKISLLSTSPEPGQNLKDASLHKKSGPLRFPGRSGRLRFLLLLKFGNCGNLWKWIGLDLRLSWPVARLSGSITNAQPSIGQLHFASNAIVMDLFVKGIQIKIYVFTTIDFVSLHCNYHRLSVEVQLLRRGYWNFDTF